MTLMGCLALMGITPSRRLFLVGGAKGIRTPDLLVANETRYQLRHSPADRPGRSARRLYHRFRGPIPQIRGRRTTPGCHRGAWAGCR